jgi:hypothetical protein
MNRRVRLTVGLGRGTCIADEHIDVGYGPVKKSGLKDKAIERNSQFTRMPLYQFLNVRSIPRQTDTTICVK